jgi:hypothetical protein
LTDWYSNPVTIGIQTTDYPVENIPFPTLTLCRKDNSPNRMQLGARILDHLRFPVYCGGLSVHFLISYN